MSTSNAIFGIETCSEAHVHHALVGDSYGGMKRLSKFIEHKSRKTKLEL